MIKAVIFDMGNVIRKFDGNIFLKEISNYSDKSFDEIKYLIYEKSDLPSKYETGMITTDKFIEGILKICSLKMEKNDFKEAYVNIFTTLPSTINLIKKLKTNYKLGLLSNTSEIHFDYAIKTIEVIGLFDAISLSFQLHSLKPDKIIFTDMLKKLKLKPQECVYIDDIKEYSDKATELGMHGINYVGYENLIKELKKLKVKI